MPSAPYAYTDIAENHFDGGAHITKGAGKDPTLALLLRDAFSRLADQESAMLDPVATVADLRAASGYTDKATIFCEAKGLFYYESTSVAADDADLVVKPTAVTGAGRWLRMSSLSPIHVTEHETGGDDVLTDLPSAATIAGGAITVANVASYLPTVNEKAGLAANSPTAINPVQTLAEQCRVVSKTVGFADVAALGAVANGQIPFDAALPAGAVPIGSRIANVTDFSGGAIATMTESLGINGGDVDRYQTPESVFTGVGAVDLFAAGVAFDGTESKHPEGGITPAVNMVATVGTLDACTAGELIAYLYYELPQA